MSYEKEIEALESEWSPDGGFFWRLRQGEFNGSQFQRTLKLVSTIQIEGEVVPRRFVALLWYMPVFMRWQLERVQENKGDVNACTAAITAITNEVERILGVP